MNQRLLRALQRGGVAAEIQHDMWGVWRDHDRRRRMIGIMSGGEIDLLKLNENLKSIDDPYQVVLSWDDSSDKHIPPDSLTAISHPLLTHLILKSQPTALRQAYSHAVRAYRRDDARTIINDKADCKIEDADHAFLSALVLDDASKLELAKAYRLRPDAVETKALSLLRRLAEVYS